MSIRITNSPIPDGRLTLFDQILKDCGGRYLSNPIDAPDQWGRYRVIYEYDNSTKANEHARRWNQLTTDVREMRTDQWWRKLIRRIKLAFRA